MDMSGIASPFGLAPWENFEDKIQCHVYAVETNPTNGIYLGTMVNLAGKSVSTPYNGNMPAVVSAIDAGIGAVLAIYDENMFPVNHIAASATGNGTIAGYVLVADNPYQRYVVQEDGDSSSIQAADIGLNADLVGTTGDDDTGVSHQYLDSSSKNTTNTLAVKILGVHPEDTISSNGAAGNHCRFIVMMNHSPLAPNVAGV